MDQTVHASAPQRIAIELLRPSDTKMQQKRRATFNLAKIAELADSIKQQGLLQPILVRQSNFNNSPKMEHYEIIAGERRYLASKLAGLTEIDCLVRDLTDAQVLEAQLVENLQREGVHPLEEAEGYRELLALKKIPADELGAQIGKSRAYVYARLKLLDLCPEAREALDNGDLDASKALVIARLSPKLQQRVMKDYRFDTGNRYSYKSLVDRVREMLLCDVAAAPFTADDATLFTLGKKVKGQQEVIELPACAGCASYGPNDIELAAELGDRRLCFNKHCFEQKCAAAFLRTRKAAEAAGKSVLTGDDAKAAIPPKFQYGSGGINHRFVDLDAPCSEVEFSEPEPDDEEGESPAWQAWADREADFKPPTYRQLLAAELPALETTLAQARNGAMHELLPVTQAKDLLKKQDIKITIPRPEPKVSQERAPQRDWEEERRIEEAKRDREIKFRTAVLKAVAGKCSGNLTKADIVALVAERVDGIGHWSGRALKECYGGKLPDPAKLKDADLGKLARLVKGADCVWPHNPPGELFDLAKRYKIDPAKIKKQLADAEKPAKKAEAKPAAKKGTKK